MIVIGVAGLVSTMWMCGGSSPLTFERIGAAFIGIASECLRFSSIAIRIGLLILGALVTVWVGYGIAGRVRVRSRRFLGGFGEIFRWTLCVAALVCLAWLVAGLVHSPDPVFIFIEYPDDFVPEPDPETFFRSGVVFFSLLVWGATLRFRAEQRSGELGGGKNEDVGT